MISRILALLLLVGVIGGASWYLFRDTPQKKILRWREASRALFFQAGDVEEAEELNRRILELVPNSTYDLLFQARLLEAKGTAGAAEEALAVYDRLIAKGDPRLAGVAVYKGRLLRRLGRFQESRGVLLSVMDSYPFEASIELGRTALGGLQFREAVIFFTRALEAAENDAQRARAHEWRAEAYAGLARMGARSAATEAEDVPDSRTETGPSTSTAGREESPYVALARRELDRALELARGVREEPGTKKALRVWLADLALKRAEFRRPGENPCWETAETVLKNRIAEDRKLGEEPDWEVLQRLAALRLNAVWFEKESLPDASDEYVENHLLKPAYDDLLEALGNLSPEEGATLLNVSPNVRTEDETDDPRKIDPRVARRRRYVLALLETAKVFLNSPESERLLADDSPLQLSKRIADAARSADPETSGAFRLLEAFALLKRNAEGDPVRARELISGYLESTVPELRPQAALEIADQCRRVAPQAPLLLELLEQAATSATSSSRGLERRIRLLASLASAPEPVGPHAARRLDEALGQAEREAQSPETALRVAELVRAVRGEDAALELLRRRLTAAPESARLRVALARGLARRFISKVMAQDRKAAAAYAREAAGHYLVLFLRHPHLGFDFSRQAGLFLAYLDAAGETFAPAEPLKEVFSEAPAQDLGAFAEAARSFLLAQTDRALEELKKVRDTESLEPSYSFLEGSVHLARAQALGRPAASGGEDPGAVAAYKNELEAAARAFRRRPNFLANRLELANLDLIRLPATADVPDTLLEKIRRLASEPKLEHQGKWLLARALHRKVLALYRNPEVKNSAVQKHFQELQTALREAIARRPDFTDTYLLLAETFILPAKEDEALRRSGIALQRQLQSPAPEKALSLLRAVPVPDERVLRALADYALLAKEYREAAFYREVLALANPSEEAFSRLFLTYLQAGEEKRLEELLAPPQKTAGEPEPKPPAVADFARRLSLVVRAKRASGPERLLTIVELLRRAEQAGGDIKELLRREIAGLLRERFQEIAAHEGLRHLYLGELAAKKRSRLVIPSEREAMRRRMIEEYRAALEAYEAAGRPVPLLVLNNLAWHLVEDPDEAARREGLELAAQARTRVDDPRLVPDVHDTYGWTLFRNGRLAEAAEVFRALVAAVDSPSYRYRLARVLFELKDLDSAQEEVQKVLDSPEDFPEREKARDLLRRIREERAKVLGSAFHTETPSPAESGSGNRP